MARRVATPGSSLGTSYMWAARARLPGLDLVDAEERREPRQADQASRLPVRCQGGQR
jgi:hypothetical protein